MKLLFDTHTFIWWDRELEVIPFTTLSLQSLAICEAPLNRHIAALSRQIELPHQDPADRFIAATAVHYQLQLATVDTRLTGATWLPTLS